MECRVHTHSAVFGTNLLLPSPGMEEMAKRIYTILHEKSQANGHPNTFDMCRMNLTAFASGEHEPEILEPIRGATVYLLHGMQLPNPNVGLVNLHLINEALVRADVHKIRAVLPFIPFQRNDRRKDNKRVPISARAVAKVIQSYAEVGQVITLDLHADQEVGYYDIPVDNIPATSIFLEDLKVRRKGDLSNTMVFSPDIGSVVRNRRAARNLGVPLGIIDKDRKGPGQTEVMAVLGDVAGKDAVLFDDMIDTGGTIISAAQRLMDEGANSVDIYGVHGLLSGNAVEKFAKAGFQVRVTDSIPRPEEFWKAHELWLTRVSVGGLLADAIYESSLMRGSVSKLSK